MGILLEHYHALALAFYLDKLLDHSFEVRLQKGRVCYEGICTDAAADVITFYPRRSNERIEQQWHPILGKLLKHRLISAASRSAVMKWRRQFCWHSCRGLRKAFQRACAEWSNLPKKYTWLDLDSNLQVESEWNTMTPQDNKKAGSMGREERRDQRPDGKIPCVIWGYIQGYVISGFPIILIKIIQCWKGRIRSSCVLLAKAQLEFEYISS